MQGEPVYVYSKLVSWSELQPDWQELSAPLDGPGCGVLLAFDTMEDLREVFPDAELSQVIRFHRAPKVEEQLARVVTP